MDYTNMTLQALKEAWGTLFADYDKKKAVFVEAWQRFMKDCDARDKKVTERRAALQAENDSISRKMEELGEKYTAVMVEGNESEADIIKRQINELSAATISNNALIDSMGRPAYSESMVKEADKAFESLGDAESALVLNRCEMLDTLDELIKDLKELREEMYYAGNGELTNRYHMRMHRRFNHQPEADW